MKKLKYLLVVIFFLTPMVLLGQILDGTNNISYQNDIKSPPVNQLQQAPVRINDPLTDEFGESGNNTFLGTGSTGGYLAVPDAGSLYNLTTAGTIEAWIMPTATTSSAPGIVAKGESSTTTFLFGWVASSTVLYFRIGGTPTTNTGGTLVPINVWSHVAVTWTGTPGNYTFTFYVNGAASGVPTPNAGTMNATTTDSLTIGITKPFGGNTFLGYIDEVKIWNTVRTQAQIAQSRFVGLGDNTATNTGNAITSATNYTGLLSSWTMNNNTRDDISGKNGTLRNGAGLYWYPYTAGYPIPYNFALYRSAASTTSFVTVPSNTAFDLNTSGTIEYWFNTSSATTTQWTVSKGVSASNMWGVGIASTGYMVIRLGSNPVVNTGGISIPANKWLHLAFTWTGTSGNYTTKYYVNGVQSGSNTTNTGTLTSNSDPLCIGILQPFNGFGLLGYADEVRVWNVERTQQQIRDNMFASCRSILPNANLVGAWNFDGNLINFAATSGVNGSFSTGGANNCYLSAYSNESTTGPVPNAIFVAHPTVLNCTGYPNGFTKKALNMSIPDNATMTDTIIIGNTAGTLNDIAVFLNIQHQKVSDLTVKLKAPNSTEVILFAAQGGTCANGILSVLDDSIGNSITSTAYLSPWTQWVKPQNPMGTFGSTPLNGNWVLTITDGFATNTGTLLGWGVRFNNAILVGTSNISSSVPDNFILHQNYPNPFNPVTKIKFEVPTSELVKITVFDILGREIKTLVSTRMNAGIYEYEFDASYLSSGTYFYKMQAGAFNAVKKMILIK